MSTRRAGLGRGLAALIPAGPTALLRELPLDRIDPNPRQPRTVFDPEELAELAASIREVGVLQPVVVRERGDRYELIAGERRVRAARLAGLERIPALVRDTTDDELLREALIENLHRADLNPLEEAAAYRQLLDDLGCTQEELAQRLGRSRPAITNTLRLLSLPPTVQRKVAAGVLSAGHARALLSLDDPAEQERLADRIVAEGWSVRTTEEAVRTATPRGRRPRRRPRLSAPGLEELAATLSEALRTRVRITMGTRHGTVRIDFTSVDELERLVGVLTRGLATDPARTGGRPVGGVLGTDPAEAALRAVGVAPGSDLAEGGDRPVGVAEQRAAGEPDEQAALGDAGDA